MSRARPVLISAAIALVAAAPLAAQPDPAPRDVAASAQELIAKRSWDDARDLLVETLSGCGARQNPRECRTLLKFTEGYLYEQRAQADPERRREYYERSAEAYGTSLDLVGENAQIRKNLALVLRELGELRAAEEQIRAAMAADPERTADYQLFLGDLREAAGDRGAAMAFYERSLRTRPGEREAARRIVSLAREDDGVTPPRALELARNLRELGHDREAVELLEVALARAGADDRATLERALPQWVRIRAELGDLSARDLSRLPDLGDSEPVRTLERLLADPVGASGTRGWWTEERERREITAGVLRHFAREWESQGEDARAAAALERAIEVAPQVDEYPQDELASGPIPVLDIALELAALYDRHDDVDAFRMLEQRLFNEKSLYYARRNLGAIHRTHTVLGLIYHRRAQFTSQWADNAIFQLTHALETGEELAARNPEHTAWPLPDLDRMLAESYAASGQADRARASYLKAARGYTELDQPRRAAEMEALARSPMSGRRG